MDTEIVLAPEWEYRTSEYEYDTGEKIVTIIVPSPEDIAVGKLMAEREKDRLWLSAMIDRGLLDVSTMLNLIYKIDIPFEEAIRKEKLLETIINHTSIQWKQY